MNYFNELATLRTAAISDIREYVEDCGETVVTINGAPAMISCDAAAGLLIGKAPVEFIDTAVLTQIADYLNALV